MGSVWRWPGQDGGIRFGGPLNQPALLIRSVPATFLLVSAAVGSVVLIGFTTVALIPLLIGVGLVAAWVVSLVLGVWAAIEGLAAMERWFENDNRFHR
jgi:hypothetical protein